SLSEEARSLAKRRHLSLRTFGEAFMNPHLGILLILLFVVTFAFSNMEATFGLLNAHLYGLSAQQTGYLFTYIGILLGLVQGLVVGGLVKRIGEGRCLTLGRLSMFFGCSLI